jgi:hypothetical protein
LLSSKPITLLIAPGLLSATAPGIEDSVASEGKRVYTPDVYHNDINPASCFCIGEAEVDKILNFTQPQSQSGSPTLSRVKFTYKFKTLEKWFEDQEVQAFLNSHGLDQILKTKNTPLQKR